MKKVLLTTFLAFSISGLAQAQDNKFAPLQPEQQMQRNYAGGPSGSPMGMDPEIEMLKEELRMQLEEMRSLKNDLTEIKEENTEEAKKAQEIAEMEAEADFVGVVDNVRLYQYKETGEFFTLTNSQYKNNQEKEGK
jgi:TolA-binding protein